VGDKYFVDVNSFWVDYIKDSTPLGNILNWMSVQGSNSANQGERGKVLYNTYINLLTLAIL